MASSPLPENASFHQRLKHRIHNYKIPLSPAGVRAAGVAYFTIPIIIGYISMKVVTRYEETHRKPYRPVFSPVEQLEYQRQQEELMKTLKKIVEEKDLKF